LDVAIGLRLRFDDEEEGEAAEKKTKILHPKKSGKIRQKIPAVKRESKR
jgi:hypothetical protein